MWSLSNWCIRAALLAPVALLLVVAIPRYHSGLAVDAAFPVPTFVVMGVRLAPESYRDAADVLAQANMEDGESLIKRADVGILAGMAADEAQLLLRDGLSRSPASVRGWALLSEQTVAQDRNAAGQMLAQSLLLGPYEYFIAGRRARTSAALWGSLPDDVVERSLRQTRLLWTEPNLNKELEPLLASQNGRALVTAALRAAPDELRALNRWLAAQRRARR